MELDHGELGAQLGLGLGRIERAARFEPLGRRAGELAALALRHVGQLVGEQLVAALGAGCKRAAREVDPITEGDRVGVVRRRDQVGGVVGVQPGCGRRVGADVGSEPRCELFGQPRPVRAATEQAGRRAVVGSGDQTERRLAAHRCDPQLAQRRGRRGRISRREDRRGTPAALGGGEQLIAQRRGRRCVLGARVGDRRQRTERALHIVEPGQPRPAIVMVGLEHRAGPSPGIEADRRPPRAVARLVHHRVWRPGTDGATSASRRAAAASWSQRR